MWACKVDAEIAETVFLTIHGATVDQYFRMLQEVMGRFVGSKFDARQIDPCKISAFKTAYFEFGKIFCKEFLERHIVLIEVLFEFVKPFATIVVSLLQGYYSKCIDIAYLVDVKCSVDALPSFGLMTNDVCDLQTGNIEGFRGRVEHHTVAPASLTAAKGW